MPAPKGQTKGQATSRGIADDAADYEDLPADDKTPPPKPRGSSMKGIADDAGLFENLVAENTEEARTLDSDWLYQKGGHVFGPLKPRELLELLYAKEIDADTPISVAEDEFAPLRRYGVFRVHLPKVAKHQAELAEAHAEEARATQRRLRRRMVWVAVAVVVGSVSAWGLVSFVRDRKEEQARLEAKAKEEALLKDLDALMASVTIEPPLVALVDDDAKEEPGRPGTPKKKRRRAIARFTTASGAEAAPTDGSELTRPEIMGGVAKAFGGFKRCIVEQMQREPDSVPDTIVLSFGITNDGVPQGVTLVDRAFRRSPLRDCMAKQLEQVRFRKYKGEVQNVEYPITIGRR